MRRYLAIFFLSLFFLYHTGYISVYWLATHQINQYWDAAITDNASLQKISIPMTLPYWADQEEYTATNGMFHIEGKTYRAVQKKYANDSLHLMVIEDRLTTHLKQSIKDWVSNASNSTEEQNSKANYLKSINKDYPQSETYDPLLNRHGDYSVNSISEYTFSIISFIAELDPFPPQALVLS